MGSIKNLIQRNKRIVIIGVAFAILLGVIVFFSTTQDSDRPIVLTPFNTRRDAKEDDINREYFLDGNGGTPVTEPVTPPPVIEVVTRSTDKLIPSDPESTRPAIEIMFIDGVGFTPKVKNAYIGQTVSWKNGSKEIIILDEMVTKNHNLNRVVVQPGETYELVMEEKGFWTYRELNSSELGRLQVY